MSNDRAQIGAAILAGGEASRYNGMAKGAIVLKPGLSIVHRELAQLREAGIRQIIIVANDPAPYKDTAVPIIPDLRPGLGPLAGVEAALYHFGDEFEGTVFLPCDLPGIGAEQLTRLVSAFRQVPAQVVAARVEDFHFEPLCAVVHNALRTAVSQALDEGERRVGVLWRKLGVRIVDFEDPRPFHNVNTPADLRAWRARRQ